jgi:hypothetical protein
MSSGSAGGVRCDRPASRRREDDIVAQFGVDEAALWVGPASSTIRRLSPRSIEGQPAGRCSRSTAGGWAGSSTRSAMNGKIGVPLGNWPPSSRRRVAGGDRRPGGANQHTRAGV